MTQKSNHQDQNGGRHAGDHSATTATDVLDTTRAKARELAQQTAQAAEANPLGIVAGGVALGALVGAVLPRSKREKELLAPIGKRLGATAIAAFAAARETGKDELKNIGLTKGAAKDQVKTLMQNVAGAAANAGKAAASAGKEELRHADDKDASQNIGTGSAAA